MKIFEIIKEQDDFSGSDEYASADDAGVSPHAPGNLDYALSDAAEQEFYAMAEDPERYFAQKSTARGRIQISPEQAQLIRQVLSNADDKTFELIGKSPMVQKAIEANYEPSLDRSYIPIEVAMEVVQKLQARG